MSGSNDSHNIVCLTYREHCLAHLLLSKTYPDNYKLLCAATRMYSSGIFHKRIDKTMPASLKENHASAASLFFKGKAKGPFSQEHKKKLSLAHMGHRDSEETKKKKSESAKGKIVSEETRSKNRLARSMQKNNGDKKVSIMGVEYKSIGEAERVTGVSRFNIWRRIKLDKYDNYYYL